MTCRRSPSRLGFSTAELMMVVVIMGTLAGMAIPKLSVLRDRNAIESVREQLAATVVAARSAARQRSVPSAVRLSGNVLSAWTFSPTTGDTVWLVRPGDISEESGASMSVNKPEDALIRFDTRGFANRADSVRVWRITIGARKDSVCIGPLGHLYKRNCAQ